VVEVGRYVDVRPPLAMGEPEPPDAQPRALEGGLRRGQRGVAGVARQALEARPEPRLAGDGDPDPAVHPQPELLLVLVAQTARGNEDHEQGHTDASLHDVDSSGSRTIMVGWPESKRST